MDSACKTTKPEIRTSLAYRNGFLCVVAERGSPQGPQPTTLKLWYPIRDAPEAELQTLLGRPVSELDPKEGIYVDEEGTVFQLAEKGETKPMIVEEIPGEVGELEQLLERLAQEREFLGEGANSCVTANDGSAEESGQRSAWVCAAQHR
jgi:hypothetical protein